MICHWTLHSKALLYKQFKFAAMKNILLTFFVFARIIFFFWNFIFFCPWSKPWGDWNFLQWIFWKLIVWQSQTEYAYQGFDKEPKIWWLEAKKCWFFQFVHTNNYRPNLIKMRLYKSFWNYTLVFYSTLFIFLRFRKIIKFFNICMPITPT